MAVVAPFTPDTSRVWTVSEARLLPEPVYCEILNGVLYMAALPFPPHADIITNLFTVLEPWVRRRRVGKVYAPQSGLYYSETNYLDPDLVFLRPSQRPRGRRHARSAALAVEVLSPSNERAPREEREALFQRMNVEELWYVDYDSRSMEVRRLTESGYVTTATFGEGDTVASEIFPGLAFPLFVAWEDVEE